MIESFDRNEFLGFFCEDGRAFLGQLRSGIETLAAGFDPVAFERCTRAAHSLAGAARMMSLPGLADLFSSTEVLLEQSLAHVRRDGPEPVFGAMKRLVDLLAEGLIAVCEKRAEDVDPGLQARWRTCLEESFPWARAAAAASVPEGPGAAVPPAPEPPPRSAAADAAPGLAGDAGLSVEALRAELARISPEMRGLFLEELAATRRELRAVTKDLSTPARAAQAGPVAFRLVHTFVGSAATVGLARAAASLRSLEVDLGAVTGGDAAREPEVRERVRLALGALLQVAGDEAAPAPAQVRPVAPLPAVDEETLSDFVEESRELIEKIEARLLHLEDGGPSLPLTQESLRDAHTLKGIAQTVGREGLAEGAHLFEEELERLRQEPARAAVFAARGLRAVDLLRRLSSGNEPEGPLLGELATSLGGGAREATDAAEAAEGTSETLRVSSRRLDQLMDLVGELVISRTRMAAQLSRLAELRRSLRSSQERLVGMVESFRRRYEFQEPSGGSGSVPSLELGFSGLELDRYDDLNVLSRSLIEISADTSEVMRELHALFGGFGAETESLQRITSTLQADITNIRMVPVSRLFRRLLRPLRDAARSEGKLVRIEMEGGETEVDRAVLEKLYGVLVHLARNAVAHGVEKPAERERRGKDQTGVIRLRAFQEGGGVSLEVADDGGGIEEKPVREAAARLGLDHAGRDVSQLIFAAGVSTRSAAGALAGRGVGLTAVRETVETMGGRVEVSTSPGLGTRLLVNVPTTLAIHQALVVEAGGEPFAIPLSVVDEVTALNGEDVQETREGPVLLLRGEAVPLRALAPLLGASATPGGDGHERPAVVVRIGGRRFVLEVDRITARQEIVLKSLGRHLASHPFIPGASLAGDGAVILVLDVARLFSGRADAYRRAEGPASVAMPAVRARRVVLVVDDSLSVRRVAQHLLTDLGVEALVAGDGVEALEVLRTQAVDLVFTDLEMPRLNGFELIASIRRNPSFSTLPVVVISSRGSEKHREHAVGLGATGYVTKPFSRQDLAEWIPGGDRRYGEAS